MTKSDTPAKNVTALVGSISLRDDELRLARDVLKEMVMKVIMSVIMCVIMFVVMCMVMCQLRCNVLFHVGCTRPRPRDCDARRAG